MLIEIINNIVLFGYISGSLLFFAAGVLFLFEGEMRASFRSSLFIVLLVVLVMFVLSGMNGVEYVTVPLFAISAIVLTYLFIPQFLFSKSKEEIPKERIDERNTMFSRNELQPGTDRFESYYREFPGHREKDDVFRKQAGLLSKKSAFYHPLTFAMADAGFYTVEAFHPLVSGVPSDSSVSVDRDKLNSFIRHWLHKRDVVSVGIAEMKQYHWYCTGGRGDRYGKNILSDHPLGIAFTVEMDDEMVNCAPYSPIVMESAQQYLNAGTIAVQLAAFLRNLGYEARAHIDGNYEVVCPLVARDAGLGEIGRMGLLMTPGLGPRVRVAVVTTNAPLKPNGRKYDSSVEDFCNKCLKCADTCPSSAIAFEGKKVIGSIKRWQINSEKCFTYWCSTGTDCGRCISVCPYSHPDNLFHNTIRFFIRNFPNFRKPAVKLDDFFYGRKPKSRKSPKWMRVMS